MVMSDNEEKKAEKLAEERAKEKAREDTEKCIWQQLECSKMALQRAVLMTHLDGTDNYRIPIVHIMEMLCVIADPLGKVVMMREMIKSPAVIIPVGIGTELPEGRPTIKGAIYFLDTRAE